MEYQLIEGGVCAAKGFQASGVHCGIRKNHTKKDLALIFSEAPCRAAAIYTQNKVKGAIENMTGLEVQDVNIRIAGINVTKEK